MEQAMASLQAQVQQLQANLGDSQQQTQRLAHDSTTAIATLSAQLEVYRAAPAASSSRTALIDTRMLTKPRQFSGKGEECPTFSTVTRAYCGALDQSLVVEMKVAELSATAVLNADLEGTPEEIRQKVYRSMSLYYLLIMLVQGRALSIAENCPENEGMELWRRLTLAYEPKATTRSAALLLKILNWSFEGDLLSSVEKWEILIKQYNGMIEATDNIPDKILIATVVSRIGHGKIQDHLILNIGKYEKYETMRAELVEISNAQTQFLPTTSANSSGRNRNDEPTPMEIGWVGGYGGKARWWRKSRPKRRRQN